MVIAVAALTVGALVASSTPSWAAEVPKPPRSVRVVPGNNRATVSWVRPSNGGSLLTQYRVAVYHQGVLLRVQEFKSTATSQVIVALKNGNTYTFKVAAKNAVGWSKFSARSAPSTMGAPSPPAKPSAVAGKNRATVSWKAPKNNGLSITSYRVTPILKGDAKPPITFNSTNTKQVIKGLGTGKQFTFAVAAHNKRGWGGLSPESTAIKIK